MGERTYEHPCYESIQIIAFSAVHSARYEGRESQAREIDRQTTSIFILRHSEGYTMVCLGWKDQTI